VEEIAGSDEASGQSSSAAAAHGFQVVKQNKSMMHRGWAHLLVCKPEKWGVHLPVVDTLVYCCCIVIAHNLISAFMKELGMTTACRCRNLRHTETLIRLAF